MSDSGSLSQRSLISRSSTGVSKTSSLKGEEVNEPVFEPSVMPMTGGARERIEALFEKLAGGVVTFQNDSGSVNGSTAMAGGFNRSMSNASLQAVRASTTMTTEPEHVSGRLEGSIAATEVIFYFAKMDEGGALSSTVGFSGFFWLLFCFVCSRFHCFVLREGGFLVDTLILVLSNTIYFSWDLLLINLLS